MERIVSREDLKRAIQELETEKTEKALQLKEQFHLAYGRFLSVKAISGTILGKVAELGFALAGGYFSKQIVGGVPGGVIKKLLGTLMQVGVTNVIVNKRKTIESVGRALIGNLLSRKSRKTNNHRTADIQATHI